MSQKAVQQKLESYDCKSQADEQNAIKEIAQEIALSALGQTDFFKKAAFHGGTALRILYGLQRFSEDLDFELLQPSPDFNWQQYLKHLQTSFKNYGFDFDVTDKSKIERSVKVGWLKDESRGGLLNLKFGSDSSMKAIKIKLEIDSNPPMHANSEVKYLDFPTAAAIRVQDKPTLFAGKCHALLCRAAIGNMRGEKGRDWFDLLWYVSQKVEPNYAYLSSALNSHGPWKGQQINVTKDWFFRELQNKVRSLDIEAIKNDVAPFLRDKVALDLWSKDFFLAMVSKLEKDISVKNAAPSANALVSKSSPKSVRTAICEACGRPFDPLAKGATPTMGPVCAKKKNQGQDGI